MVVIRDCPRYDLLEYFCIVTVNSYALTQQ